VETGRVFCDRSAKPVEDGLNAGCIDTRAFWIPAKAECALAESVAVIRAHNDD
jgi:hypothetical protein